MKAKYLVFVRVDLDSQPRAAPTKIFSTLPAQLMHLGVAIKHVTVVANPCKS